MRLVAPFGFYGSGNIGDEATLLGFGRLMERFGGGVGVDVASSDPAHTKRVDRIYLSRKWEEPGNLSAGNKNPGLPWISGLVGRGWKMMWKISGKIRFIYKWGLTTICPVPEN